MSGYVKLVHISSGKVRLFQIVTLVQISSV